MVSSQTFVIVGGGLAGAKAAEALRNSEFDGQIILFADEAHLPGAQLGDFEHLLADELGLADGAVNARESHLLNEGVADVGLGLRGEPSPLDVFGDGDGTGLDPLDRKSVV